MKSYSRTHLAQPDLLRSAVAHRTGERTHTAELLADIAEIDARKAYVPAGYSSISLYCMGELQLSEQSAYKRIHAARAAREFPVLFEAVADGRLHLSAVCLLAPHLISENVDDLVIAATHKTKAEIELLLARRFPRTEEMTIIEPAPQAPITSAQLAPGRVEESTERMESQRAPGRVQPSAKVTPIAAGRYTMHVSIGQSTQDKLQYAQELLSHQIVTGDIEAVLERALDALIRQLEKAKFAATDRPRARHGSRANGRNVPDPVKRAVWERDGGQCTFLSETGHRCSARALLEFDHIDPVARGGVATVDGTRLLCRAHNQHEAERVFGAEFMKQKREAAQARRAVKRGERTGRPAAATCPGASSVASARPEPNPDVLQCLRNLGCRADEARAAAALSDAVPNATLQEQVRVALSYFHKGRSATAAAAT